MYCVMFDLFKHFKPNLNLRFSCLISLESISWFDLIFVFPLQGLNSKSVAPAGIP